MKTFTKFAAVLMLGLTLSGCDSNRTLCGQRYESYGLLDADTVKKPDVHYEVSVANVIVSVIFSETIFVPVYLIGFHLYEPETRTCPEVKP